MIDVAPLRRSYTQDGLSSSDLTKEPIEFFEKWLQTTIDSKIYDPNAFVLSTANKEGTVHSRIVLLKNYDKESLVFYTNLGSKKAHDIEENPKVSALFPWYFLERQVIFTGVCEKLSIPEVIKYFHSRPRDSQLGAWASEQSSKINTRSMIESKFMEMKEKFLNKEIPLPSFWGGYRIKINTVEFWQGRENRLHDRFMYTKVDNTWEIDRLQP